MLREMCDPVEICSDPGGRRIEQFCLTWAMMLFEEKGTQDIGPTMSEITTPLDAVPDLYGPERQGYGYFAFRTVGPYA